MKEELSDLLSARVVACEIASRNLDAVPLRTRPAFETQMRQATEEVRQLDARYEAELARRTIVIGVSGSDEQLQQVMDFVYTMEEAAPYHRFGPYLAMAVHVAPSIGPSGQFAVEQVMLVHGELRQLVEELGLPDEPPWPDFREQPLVRPETKLADVATIVRQLVRSVIGDKVLCKHALRSAANAARARTFAGPSFKLVVPGPIVDDLRALKSVFRSTRSFVLPPEAEVDEAFVSNLVRNGKITQKS